MRQGRLQYRSRLHLSWLCLTFTRYFFALSGTKGVFAYPVGRRSGDLHRNRVAGVAQFVARGHVQHARLEIDQLGLAVMGIGADDHPVADAGLVGGGTVHRDDPRAFLAANGIGGEALAVVDVVDLDLFVLTDPGQVQPLAVDGAGTFVIEHRVGDFGAMQFGFEHDGVHGVFPWADPRAAPRICGAWRRAAAVCPKPWGRAIGRSGRAVEVQVQVVDQARGAEEGRDQDHQVAVLGRRRAQVQGVADFQVVAAQAGAFDLPGLLGQQLGVVALALFDGLGDLLQAAIQRRRLGPLLFVEKAVARGQRQAVGGAYGRFADDLDRHVQVMHQLPDHRQLLEVLLTEYRQVRLDHVEQLADHRRHAFEMPGTAGAAQAFGELRDADAGLARHAAGVHFLDTGGEQQVATGLEQFFLVGGEGSRVLVEVFVGAELQRVDEDARHHEVRSLRGLGYQGRVAAVQVAHGRHETDALAFTAGTSHGGAQFENGLDCVHALNPCSIPGKVAALTSLT